MILEDRIEKYQILADNPSFNSPVTEREQDREIAETLKKLYYIERGVHYDDVMKQTRRIK